MGTTFSECEKDDEMNKPWGWCWCVDDAPARFADKARAALLRDWHPDAIRAMRTEANLGDRWPELGAAAAAKYPPTPTREGRRGLDS